MCEQKKKIGAVERTWLPNRARLAALALLVFFANSGNPPAASQAHTQLALDPSYGSTGLRLKAENGFLILSAATTRDGAGSQIEVFNTRTGYMLPVNVMSSLEGAQAVGISDVSVGPTGTMAVGAQLYSSRTQAKSSLLLLGSGGQLLASVDLRKGLGIAKVAVDEIGNVWALGLGAGVDEPADVPVLTEYDRDGTVVAEFLRFSDFPLDGPIIHEGIETGGDLSFGFTAGTVWFWLPSSRELVTVNRDDSRVERTVTGLPQGQRSGDASETVRVHKTWLLQPGVMLAQAAFLKRTLTGASVRNALYQWSKPDGWRIVPDPELSPNPGRFLGAEGNQTVFATFNADNSWLGIDTFVPQVSLTPQ